MSLVSADEEEEEEENTSPEKKVTVQEALAAAQTLQSFLDYHGDDVHQHSLVQLKCLLTDTKVSSSKQAKITDFLKKCMSLKLLCFICLFFLIGNILYSFDYNH